MHHDEQELLSLWEGWHWDDNKGGWFDSGLCAKARREEVEYIRRHMMYMGVPRERRACARRRRHPSREDGRRLTRDNQGSQTCAGGGSRRHTRLLLEALKVVLSKMATVELGGKVVAVVDVRRAYLYAPARRRVFVKLSPGDYQAGDGHICGLLQDSLYGTRDAALNWEEELTSTLGNLKLTRGVACACVWQGCIKGKHVVATVHGDDITIGGERSVVEFLIKMI